MTQQVQVLNHLKKGSLTSIQALRKCGTMRLAAYVFNLKREGYKIISDNINVGSKSKPKYVTNYSLKK